MKKLIILALAAISFASCKFENNYSVRRVMHDGHDYATVITTEAEYHRGQIIEIKGEAFEVYFLNSTNLK